MVSHGGRHSGLHAKVGALPAAVVVAALLGGCGGETPDLNLCATKWGQATVLETGSLLAAHPKAAVDGAGAATLLWDASTGSQTVFVPHASRSASGSTWTAPATLESSPATLQSFALALAGSGSTPFAVWTSQDVASEPVLRSATFTTAWSTPTTLPARIASDGVAFAGNADGAGVGAWTEPDPSGNYRLVAARRSAAGAWSAPLVVDAALPFTNLLDVSPAIAIDSRGEAMAAWIGSGSVLSLERRVFASRLASGAVAWTPPAPIDAPGGSSFQPKVVATGDGRFVAVWMQSLAGRFSVYANAFDGSTWRQGPDLIEDDDRGDVGMIALATQAAGAAQAVWMQLDENRTSRISGNRFSGADWESAATQVSAAQADTQRAYPAVAVDGRGNAIAVWFASAAGSGQIALECSSRASGTARWTSPLTLSSGDIVPASRPPALAMNANGVAVVGWAAPDGANVAIVARTRRP